MNNDKRYAKEDSYVILNSLYHKGYYSLLLPKISGDLGPKLANIDFLVVFTSKPIRLCVEESGSNDADVITFSNKYCVR